MSRRLVVVDLETTGLDADKHLPLEVASATAHSLPRYFVPYISRVDIAAADPDALRVNRYYERGVYKYQKDPSATRESYALLYELLEGNTLAGSNPRFDAGFLSKRFTDYGWAPEPWHHRLADLSAYAAGVLRIAPTELPGLQAVCDVLGVINKEPHSAMGDAQATADCFGILMEHE